MEKLNRAICELGYSFSTVIVIVVEMFVILVIVSLIEKNFQPSQQHLFGLLLKLANDDDDQLKPKLRNCETTRVEKTGVLHLQNDVMH